MAPAFPELVEVIRAFGFVLARHHQREPPGLYGVRQEYFTSTPLHLATFGETLSHTAVSVPPTMQPDFTGMAMAGATGFLAAQPTVSTSANARLAPFHFLGQGIAILVITSTSLDKR
jgi:hypothetical protein